MMKKPARGKDLTAAEKACLPASARVSEVGRCQRLPGASHVPDASLSRKLPPPANVTGPITLARLFGTKGANWPRGFRQTPFRPGRPREMGLVSALAWLISSPVLGVPRMVHGVAKGLRNAATRAERTLAEELLALRMRLETGEITDAEFEREKARIEAAAKEAESPNGKLPEQERTSC